MPTQSRGHGTRNEFFTMNRREAIATSVVAVSALTLHAAEAKPRVLIIVGPSTHPPGTHEVAAAGRLMKHGLEALGLAAEVHTTWPKALGDVASVVFIGDLFPPAVMPESDAIHADLAAMMKRGTGMVCLHYATGLEAKHVKDDGDHPLLYWIGGYFATRCKHHQSIAKVFPKATIEPAKIKHDVLKGWKEFTVHDEPYINNFFGKNDIAKNVTVLATSQLPPEKPKAEPVAWAVEREDGGRGVGLVMPHFYRNWKHDDLRVFIFNAILWSAKQPVPKTGASVVLPDLAKFEPAAVEPVPKTK